MYVESTDRSQGKRVGKSSLVKVIACEVFFNFPFHLKLLYWKWIPKCDTFCAEAYWGWEASFSSCPSSTIILWRYTQQKECLLFTAVVIYIVRYTFIFPIIILLSFTRRRLYVRLYKIPPVYTSNTKTFQCLFSISEWGYCRLSWGWKGKMRKINDIDNNYRFVYCAASEKARWSYCWSPNDHTKAMNEKKEL